MRFDVAAEEGGERLGAAFVAAATKSLNVRYGELGCTRNTSSDWMNPAIGTTWLMTEGAPCMMGVVNTGEASVRSKFSSPFLPST